MDEKLSALSIKWMIPKQKRNRFYLFLFCFAGAARSITLVLYCNWYEVLSNVLSNNLYVKHFFFT